MELGRSVSGILSTDGAKMSTMSSYYADDNEQPERAPLDLTE